MVGYSNQYRATNKQRKANYAFGDGRKNSRRTGGGFSSGSGWSLMTWLKIVGVIVILYLCRSAIQSVLDFFTSFYSKQDSPTGDNLSSLAENSSGLAADVMKSLRSVWDTLSGGGFKPIDPQLYPTKDGSQFTLGMDGVQDAADAEGAMSGAGLNLDALTDVFYNSDGAHLIAMYNAYGLKSYGLLSADGDLLMNVSHELKAPMAGILINNNNSDETRLEVLADLRQYWNDRVNYEW